MSSGHLFFGSVSDSFLSSRRSPPAAAAAATVARLRTKFGICCRHNFFDANSASHPRNGGWRCNNSLFPKMSVRLRQRNASPRKSTTCIKGKGLSSALPLPTNPSLDRGASFRITFFISEHHLFPPLPPLHRRRRRHGEDN